MKKALLFVPLLALAISLVAAPLSAASKDVDLKAEDGTMLKATYMSPGKPGPAMLLVHQCNMDRKSWSSIAEPLVAAGVHVLTLDLRGFGESGGKGPREAGGFPAFLETAHGDVDMAYEFLVSQEGVDTSRLAAGGASCGAMLTADLASRQPAIKTLMLLSGPPSAAAVEHMASKKGPAVFAAASTGDTITPGVADALKGAVDGSPNPHSTAKIYDGTEHGLPMFAKNAELEPALVGWLKKELTGS